MNKNPRNYCSYVIICIGTLKKGGDKGFDEGIKYFHIGLKNFHSQNLKLIIYPFPDGKKKNSQCYPYSLT